MFSFIDGDFLLFPLAGAAGWLLSTLQNWSLHRRTYSLECAVADLETKLLVEIKRRAGRERQSQRSFELDIVEAAKNAAPPEPALPWWAKLKKG